MRSAVTRYLQSLFEGRLPNAAEWNEHLVAFHEREDVTGAPLRLLRTSDGSSSYDTLARRLFALAPEAHSILDVGCGGGALLESLRGTYPKGVSLTGIDLSRDEIDRARKRVPEAMLLCGDVLTVEGPPVACDVIVSHLSFLSFARLRGILARLRGIIREPGLLAYVVEDPLADNVLFRVLSMLVQLLRERFPMFLPSVPESAPMQSDQDIIAINRAAGFVHTRIEQYELLADCNADQLWEIVRSVYVFGLLEHSILDTLRDAVLASHARHVGGSGTLQLAMPVRFVTARAEAGKDSTLERGTDAQ
jgi:SAM-dependent methyltransferase